MLRLQHMPSLRLFGISISFQPIFKRGTCGRLTPAPTEFVSNIPNLLISMQCRANGSLVVLAFWKTETLQIKNE